jgi:3-methyladenine DNA glycosylase AlkD
MEKDIISAVRQDLTRQADEKTKNIASHFFKEKVIVYGVKSSLVDNIAKKFIPDIQKLSKQEVFDLCEDLFKSDYMEEAFIAADWAYLVREKYETSDFTIFELWLNRYINNWAKCDTLCNHTIGSFVEKFPQFILNLKGWTRSENRWMRRAAAVTLIIPAKKGKFLEDILEISDNLLTDPDDLVQKGYGWLLKDASIKHQAEVLAYVMLKKQTMPRTALRYAIERMPADLKRQEMAR